MVGKYFSFNPDAISVVSQGINSPGDSHDSGDVLPPAQSQHEALRRKVARELEEIASTVMPFGRFCGRRLHELPAEYLQWFVARGWPRGRLGELMQMVYQMKADGSDVAFDPFRAPAARRGRADV